MMNSVLTLTNTLNDEKKLNDLDLNVKEVGGDCQQSHSAVRVYHCFCSKTSMGKYGRTIL